MRVGLLSDVHGNLAALRTVATALDVEETLIPEAWSVDQTVDRILADLQNTRAGALRPVG
jgi:hypothetical protein